MKVKQMSRRPWSSCSVTQTVGAGLADGVCFAAVQPSGTRAIGISRIGSSWNFGHRAINGMTVKANNNRVETVSTVPRDSNVGRL